VLAIQVLDKTGQALAAGQTFAFGKGLGGAVERIDIVVDAMKELAHLIVGKLIGVLRSRIGGQKRVVDGLVTFSKLAVGVVQADDGFGDVGGLLHAGPQLLTADVGAAHQRIGEGFLQIANQPFAGVLRERGDVYPEYAGEFDQHGGGQRALIGFDLVEVTC